MVGTSIDAQLSYAISNAIRSALTEFFYQNQNETFYFIPLVITGEANAPSLSAWSLEALAREFSRKQTALNSVLSIKWSYADSPYYPIGDSYFQQVRQQLESRPNWRSLSDQGWDDEFAIRVSSMETAMKELDEEGVFGRGSKRDRILINVEVIPPDYSNVLRAKRLNNSSAMHEWLVEAAEPPEN